MVKVFCFVADLQLVILKGVSEVGSRSVSLGLMDEGEGFGARPALRINDRWRREWWAPAIIENVLHSGELRAGILEVLMVLGLRADDIGQKRAKRGVGLDLRNRKDLAYFDVYLTSKYTWLLEICQEERFCQ